jgi:hypothetical protein
MQVEERRDRGTVYNRAYLASLRRNPASQTSDTLGTLGENALFIEDIIFKEG